MKRREFITLLGGVAAAWPVAADAQQGGVPRRIGVLMGVANNAVGQARAKAFQQELERLGWIDGRNIAIDLRWTGGDSEHLVELATELVRLKADVIVTEGTPPTVAAKQVTSVIPIIFVSAADPLGTGLVSSLARPGGNVTGLSNQNGDLAGKRVELLREIIPGLDRLGILANVDNIASGPVVREVDAAAKALGLDVVRLEIRRAEDIAPAVEAFKGPARAVFVVGDALTNANALRINTLALGSRLPTMYGTREQLEAGGLVSYGTDILDLRRRAADYVDKILRGAKPGDIPVEQPTKFQLVINLTTARALGLTIPESFLALADEVIE
jgi:putative ABC transport system substrate-binding protein